jgi:DNA repair exonuclease SbcCD ATPase subunit
MHKPAFFLKADCHLLEMRFEQLCLDAHLKVQFPVAKFLSDEMRDLDAQLKEYFRKAKIDHPEDIPASYETFTGRIHSFRQWQDLRSELGLLERDSTSDIAVGTLPDLIERLKRQRQAAWSKMEELIIKYPEIAESSDCLTVLTKRTDFAQRLTGYSELLHAYQKEKEELSIKVRSSLKNYEDHYLKLEEQLELLEIQIKEFKQTKLSLELALKTFQQMAYETHRNWSQQLNEISKELLTNIGSDFESIQFDQNLQITARRKGEVEPWQPANIESQASIGTREQLYWLARMAICRFLSRGSALPIILDEPFSELDDERFLKSMRFLLNVLVRDHQVIIFSCHQERHRWLMEQLNGQEKELIQNCELKPSLESASIPIQ